MKRIVMLVVSFSLILLPMVLSDSHERDFVREGIYKIVDFKEGETVVSIKNEKKSYTWDAETLKIKACKDKSDCPSKCCRDGPLLVPFNVQFSLSGRLAFRKSGQYCREAKKCNDDCKDPDGTSLRTRGTTTVQFEDDKGRKIISHQDGCLQYSKGNFLNSDGKVAMAKSEFDGIRAKAVEGDTRAYAQLKSIMLLSGNSVLEGTCQGSGLGLPGYFCPEGEKCSLGRCGPASGCSDSDESTDPSADMYTKGTTSIEITQVLPHSTLFHYDFCANLHKSSFYPNGKAPGDIGHSGKVIKIGTVPFTTEIFRKQAERIVNEPKMTSLAYDEILRLKTTNEVGENVGNVEIEGDCSKKGYLRIQPCDNGCAGGVCKKTASCTRKESANPLKRSTTTYTVPESNTEETHTDFCVTLDVLNKRLYRVFGTTSTGESNAGLLRGIEDFNSGKLGAYQNIASYETTFRGLSSGSSVVKVSCQGGRPSVSEEACAMDKFCAHGTCVPIPCIDSDGGGANEERQQGKVQGWVGTDPGELSPAMASDFCATNFKSSVDGRGNVVLESGGSFSDSGSQMPVTSLPTGSVKMSNSEFSEHKDDFFIFGQPDALATMQNVETSIGNVLVEFTCNNINRIGVKVVTCPCENGKCVGQPENTRLACKDTIDNDKDGKVDCKDSDCNAEGADYCKEDDKNACTNKVDDDDDGLTDCKDPECTKDPNRNYCREDSRGLCTNDKDDDGDGFKNCQDPDCWQRNADGSPWCCCQGERVNEKLRCQRNYQCIASKSDANGGCKNAVRGNSFTIENNLIGNACQKTKNRCDPDGKDTPGDCLKCAFDSARDRKYYRWFVDRTDAKECHECSEKKLAARLFLQLRAPLIVQKPVTTHTRSMGVADCKTSSGANGFCSCGNCQAEKPCKGRVIFKDICTNECSEKGELVKYNCNRVTGHCDKISSEGCGNRFCGYTKSGARCSGPFEMIFARKFANFKEIFAWKNPFHNTLLVLKYAAKGAAAFYVPGSGIVNLPKTIAKFKEDVHTHMAAQNADHVEAKGKVKLKYLDKGREKFYNYIVNLETKNPRPDRPIPPDKHRSKPCKEVKS